MIEIGMVAEPLGWTKWSEARGLLHPALMRGDDKWPEVEADLARNDRQLWAVMDSGYLLAAAATRIAQARDGEVAEVTLVGGREAKAWLADLSATIEASARDIGCIGLRAYGRLGWRDMLTAIGWKPATIAYQKAF